MTAADAPGREPITVDVTLRITVSPDDWDLVYGTGTLPEAVHTDVVKYTHTAAQHMITSSGGAIRTVEHAPPTVGPRPARRPGPVDRAAFLTAAFAAAGTGDTIEVPDAGPVTPADVLAVAAAAAQHYRDGQRRDPAADAAAADVLTPGWWSLACRITRAEQWAAGAALLDFIERHVTQPAPAGTVQP